MKKKLVLKKIGDLISEKSERNKHLENYPVFSVTNSEGFVRSTDYFDKEVFSKNLSNYKIVKKGHFAYNPSRINVGSVDYLKNQSSVIVSPLYVIFEVKERLLFQEYLKIFLKSERGKAAIGVKTSGSVRDNLSYNSLCEILIPLLPLEEQIQIATVLSKAENLIAKRKKSIELLDEFVKSTFLEMFGDPVRNERGWEKKKLVELGSLDRGVSKNRPRNAPELLGGIYPLIQTGDVTNAGLYIKNYSQTYSELGLNQSKMWKKGTLCITIAANIARTGILDFDACFPDSVVGFVSNSQKVNSIYIHFLFGFIQQILEKNAPQAAQKNINLEILRSLKIPKPDIEAQNQFAEIVNKVEVLKEKHQRSLEELENLYGSLSQRAFRGEL
ncbi:MAG TPA: restriction endonuclease subunit S [bacterium]|nr:restriction endonuclease subunit S [bacterium]